MDQLLARTMVEALSKGLNPLLGTALPNADVCASEEVQEALITVLAACTIESNEVLLKRLREEKIEEAAEKREQRKKQYTNYGSPWTKNEEERALQLNRDYNIWYTAKVLGRSPGSIKSKLEHLGAIPNKKRYRKCVHAPPRQDTGYRRGGRSCVEESVQREKKPRLNVPAIRSWMGIVRDDELQGVYNKLSFVFIDTFEIEHYRAVIWAKDSKRTINVGNIMFRTAYWVVMA